MNNNIKLIFFDIGNVLLYRKRNPLDKIAEQLMLDIDDVKLAHKKAGEHKDFATNFKNMRDMKGQHIFSEYAAKLFLDEIGLEQTKKNIEIIKMAWMSQEFDLLPGAIKILNYLKPKYRLGVISNGMPSRRHYEMAEFELIPYFDPIILSREIGIEKPDTSIFDLALKMANMEPNQVAFIDDHPDYLQGAYKAGIDCLFQVTSHNKFELHKKATEIEDLAQLKDYF